MSDTRFDNPDLDAAQLGQLLGMTERMVKDRVANGRFICHWIAGTEENPRGMRFTAEEVKYNRDTLRTNRPALTVAGLTDAKIRKGVARRRKAQGLTNSPQSNAA